MKKIGILSDTHGFIDEQVLNFFNDCDLILHAGDIGNPDVVDRISSFKPFKAVYGNIDGNEIRCMFPSIENFSIEKIDIIMSHITGYPGRYQKAIEATLALKPPKLLIGGHSHILKVIYDRKYDLLFINPGAAGKYGIHIIRTCINLVINDDRISDLKILELPK